MKRFLSLFLALMLLFSLSACTTEPDPSDADDPAGARGEMITLPTTDPSGVAVTIPPTVDSIVALAPSLCQTLVHLGLGDKIIGYDLNSVGLEGLAEDAPTFDTMNPDIEALVALDPDVVLVSSLSLYEQEAPYQPLLDAGICVLCVPTSVSIENIRSDITFLAAAFQQVEKGEEIIANLNAELDRLAEQAKAIPEDARKTAYFEISAAPYMYSTGDGTYLDEMMELVGLTNVLADQSDWLSVEAETIVEANPDIIFTNVPYVDDPVAEILSRDGWAGITAVAEKDVYLIDNMSSSLPNENIVIALREMAAAAYPDYFEAAS